MTILTTILIVIAALIALLLIIALFAKKSYAVEREIIINKPTSEVFNHIKFLKNQDNFSKWATMDLNMKKEYTGTDGTPGFISAWDSENKKVGKGEQEIKKIEEGKRLDTELRFIKPFAGLANAYMTTETAGAGNTKVTWGFDSKMNYPMNIMLLFMNMDKMFGADFATGLSNLKAILEK